MKKVNAGAAECWHANRKSVEKRPRASDQILSGGSYRGLYLSEVLWFCYLAELWNCFCCYGVSSAFISHVSYSQSVYSSFFFCKFKCRLNNMTFTCLASLSKLYQYTNTIRKWFILLIYLTSSHWKVIPYRSVIDLLPNVLKWDAWMRFLFLFKLCGLKTRKGAQ